MTNDAIQLKNTPSFINRKYTKSVFHARLKHMMEQLFMYFLLNKIGVSTCKYLLKIGYNLPKVIH